MSLPFPWLDRTWCQIRSVHALDRLPHGLILGGLPGIGKLQFGRYLARFLMCHQPQQQPCGRCKSCLLLNADSHPDVQVFSPEEEGKILKVDQVRDLNEFIAKTPQQGRRKVALLHPAEAMNLNAANALLKTLEEPSADAVLILISHAPGQLLPTIRSRCQVWTIPTPDRPEVLPWLRGQVEVADDQAEYLLKIAQGSPLLALKLAREEMVKLRQDMLDDLAAVLKRDKSPFEIAARWQKYSLATTLDWLYQWTASMLAFRATGDGEQIYDAQGRKMLEYVATKASSIQLYELLDQLNAAIRSLQLHQNPNVQLLLESLLCRWLSLIARKDSRQAS